MGEASPGPDGRSRRWVASGGVRTAWRRAREASRALPDEAWRRWWIVLGAGFAASCLFTWGLTCLGRWLAPRGLDAWDRKTLVAIVERSPLSFPDATVFESPGNLAYLVPLVGGVTLVAMWRARPLVAASVLACYVLARPLIFLGWWVWDRPRPDMVGGGIAAPELHSFPSGHAALAFSTYGLLAWLWMRATPYAGERALAGLLLIVWTGLINLARVRLGTHWPSDVIAGTLIGAAWLGAVIAALRTAERVGER